MDYGRMPNQDTVTRTIAALKARNIFVDLVENKEQALAKLKSLIPEGGQVMTGGSATLEQIGFIDLLKSGRHPWLNLKNEIFSEKDPAKQAELRKKSVLAEHFVASVHAIAETGETVVASFSGSQIPSFAFTSNHVIWVAGAQKIVPTLEDAMRRVREYCLPHEDQRMKSIGGAGSAIGMLLVFERLTLPQRRIDLILINESVGV